METPMITTILVAKVIFLLLGVMFTLSIAVKVSLRDGVAGITIFLASLGIVGFATLQWLI